MTQFRRQLFLPGLVLLLTGCARLTPPPAPLTTLDPVRCTERMMVNGASPLVLDQKNADAVVMDGNSPCTLDESGRPATYAVFLLPPESVAYEVTIDSAQSANAVFPFKVIVLDSLGKPLRSLPKDRITQRGGMLRANYFHVAAARTERHLAVVADTDDLGKTQERLVQGASTTYIPVGTGGVMYSSGTETKSTITKAYNGNLTLAARRR